MKKVLVVLSLLAFVAVFAVPTQVVAQDAKAKVVVVDKKVSKKASKAKQAEAAATGSCCESKGAKEEGKSCAATCTEAAACKGMAEKKK